MHRSPPSHLCRSSVRGQLEPQDSRTAKGWRYIQTTDTPNQLKVLLPPGTASMYEQLLKLENYELRKGSSLSWERILEIRHLKDRMIRKCQRLAKVPLMRPAGEAIDLSFLTIVAPSDFRLKEMEGWFLDQHARVQQKRREKVSSTPCKCTKCLASLANQEGSSQVNKVKASGTTNQSDPPPQRKVELHQQRPRYPSHSTVVPSLIGKSVSIPYRNDSTATSTPPFPRVVTSPPPLPHLLRIRDLDTGFDRSDDPQRIVSLPNKTLTKPELSNAEPELPKPTESSSTVSNSQVRRRPSCIKRSNTTKRVSWVDDQDLDAQVFRYASVTREIQVPGLKWEKLRDIYTEQMLGLETLHRQVEESLEHLRSESEHLRRADEILKSQRETLRATFEEFEQQQLRFQAKGKCKKL
ncbi:hypothetical protein C0989_003012 [Termitomyces sp. Mn162]|nr:hypothetical protein C0989_003012 [Termitomyces sp. Mn162]